MHYSVVFVYAYNLDWIAHEERMDTAAVREQQGIAAPLLPHQSNGATHNGVGNNYWDVRGTAVDQ